MTASSFYEVPNTAQALVARSLSDPLRFQDWEAAAVEWNGEPEPSGAVRFPDGSAVAFVCGGLPVEYIGG